MTTKSYSKYVLKKSEDEMVNNEENSMIFQSSMQLDDQHIVYGMASLTR